MLECFDYSHKSVEDPDFVVFGTVKNKFHAVHHLTLSLDGKSYHLDDVCGVTFCQAFQSVRCLKIDANYMDGIFTWSGLLRHFMDDCHSLQQVTICCADSIWTGMGTLVLWLTNRMGLGHGRLHVKFTGSFPSISQSTFVETYNHLCKCCMLELDILMPPRCTFLCQNILHCG